MAGDQRLCVVVSLRLRISSGCDTLFFGKVDRASLVPRQRSLHPILLVRIDIVIESLSPHISHLLLAHRIRRTFSLGGTGNFPSLLSPICRRIDFSRFPSRHQVDILASSGMTFRRRNSAEKHGWRKMSATSFMSGIAAGDLKKIW